MPDSLVAFPAHATTIQTGKSHPRDFQLIESYAD
jgi:hypothetical protein